MCAHANVDCVCVIGWDGGWQRHGFLTEEQAAPIFVQIALGLDYCHVRKVVHRDVKLDNILLDAATLSVKVFDFGFATRFKDGVRLVEW